MYLRDGKVWQVSDFPFDPLIYRWLDRQPEEIYPKK
jgi:hypothetical protein